jgi:CBS domain-containing protein
MELRNIMTNDVTAVKRNTPVVDAARIMKDHNVGAIPVVDGNK